MNKRITTGSRAFFSGLEGFAPKDKDTLVIINPTEAIGFEYMRQTSNDTEDIFEIVHRPKEELISYALERAKPMAICRFLTPEFAEAIGLLPTDLLTLKPMRDSLDTKHSYLGIIYDAYLENQSFILTDAQRSQAFAAYKAARPEKKDKSDHKLLP